MGAAQTIVSLKELKISVIFWISILIDKLMDCIIESCEIVFD